MAAVIEVRFHETRKCPVGSLAWHPDLGLVDVLEARGWERLVRVGRPAPGKAAEAAVDVRELELVDTDAVFGVALAGGLDQRFLRELVEADDGELTEIRDWEDGVARLDQSGTGPTTR